LFAIGAEEKPAFHLAVRPGINDSAPWRVSSTFGPGEFRSHASPLIALRIDNNTTDFHTAEFEGLTSFFHCR
jgi:hypothetical protein